MLGRDVRIPLSCDDQIPCSYDLDLDTRLAEETTVLVESYTVQSLRTFS